MTKKKIDPNAPYKLENHPCHSRRDFLAQGFLTGLSFTMLPGLVSLLQSNIATAAECGLGATTAINRVPVLIFDLAGGANFAGSNIMVGKAGGQMDFLSSYESIGLPMNMHPRNAGQINTELGLAFHNDSSILRGISSTALPATRAKVEGGIFCGASNDDTQNNPHNPMYWLAKAGALGELSNLAGTQNSDSGGNSMAPASSIVPSLRPVVLNSQQDALGLVNIGRLGSLFGNDKAQKILKTVERMSAQRLQKFEARALPDQIKELVNCGYIESQDLLSRFSASAVDPAQDPLVTSAFNNFNDGDQRKTATMAKLVLDGYIGVGTVQKGGYDYHTNDRAVGETRDFEIGQLIGRVMQLASMKQKDILIYVFTDGGVSANGAVDNSVGGRGKIPWVGDSSQRSSSFMLLYRHAGRATLRNTGIRQIGSYKDNGAVDTTSTLISNSVTNLSKAMVANYLSLSGQEGKLAEVLGDNPFGSNLNKYLFFNKIN